MTRALFLLTDTDLWFDVINDLSNSYNVMPSFFIGENASGARLQRVFGTSMMSRKDLFNLFDNDKYTKSIDCELLMRISYSEPILNEMLTRYTVGELDYHAMRSYFLDSLAITLGIIKKHKIDLIVCGSAPHRYHDYMFYVLSKALNLVFVTYETTLVNNRSYIMSSLEDRSLVFSLKNRVKFNPSNEAIECYNKIRLEKKAIKLDYITASGPNSINKSDRPIYISIRRSIAFMVKMFFSGALFRKDKSKISDYTYRVFPNISNPSLFSLGLNRIKNVIKINACISFYKKNAFYANSQESYILFAAHFQPERSTCPDGGYFSDLRLAIDMLYNALPDGMYLYYREHPTTFKALDVIGSPRSLKFYSDLKMKYPRLKFIQTDENMVGLIESSKAVSTITGSVGWEAIIKGKPVFLFGDSWYRHAPNVFSVDDSKQLKNDILTSLLDDYDYKYEILNFIDSVFQKTTDFSKLQHSNIAFRKNIDSSQYYKKGDQISFKLATMIYNVYTENIIKEKKPANVKKNF